MSKAPGKKEVVGKVAPNAIQTILRLHRAASQAATQMAVYAALCGMELAKAKKLAGHGGWNTFVEEKCGFTIRTASNYLALGEKIRERVKSETGVSDLLAAAPSDLSAEQQETLFALVAQAIDGATLTDLYREYGIVKRLEGGAEGGYRPNPALVQTFLRRYHAPLEGTLYADLPAEVQEHFRRWVRAEEGDGAQLSLDFYQVTVGRFNEFAPKRREIIDALPASEREHLAATLEEWLTDLKAVQD